jgi:hypothetical protein
VKTETSRVPEGCWLFAKWIRYSGRSAGAPAQIPSIQNLTPQPNRTMVYFIELMSLRQFDSRLDSKTRGYATANAKTASPRTQRIAS